VPGPDSASLPVSASLLGYGPLPGAEMFSYFLALLAWILAFTAAVLTPILALVRRLRRGKRPPPAETLSATQSESRTRLA
jgi:hypothetical protein